MKIPRTLLVAACLSAFVSGARAIEYESDEGTDAHVPTVAHELFLLAPGDTIAPEAVRADLEYTANMKRHHEGAVTMSTDYLEDPRGTNPVLRKLARAIIANQRFEIAVMDHIQDWVRDGPEIVADLGFVRIGRRQMGVDGLEHQWQFVKWRPPGALDLALAPGLEVSERDVKFSREMMLHHQMALDMARAYNADPNATNLILRQLNLDIIVDQANEIALLQQIVDRFPGDPEAVELDRSIPGMDMPMAADGDGSMKGMDHGMPH